MTQEGRAGGALVNTESQSTDRATASTARDESEGLLTRYWGERIAQRLIR